MGIYVSLSKKAFRSQPTTATCPAQPEQEHRVTGGEERDLGGLPLGQIGVITRLKAAGLTRRRLLDLGFVPGSLVEAIRHGPSGDPIAFGIKGTVVALRREEAEQIMMLPPASYREEGRDNGAGVIP